MQGVSRARRWIHGTEDKVLPQAKQSLGNVVAPLISALQVRSVRALVSFPPVCPCVFLSYFLLLVLLLRLTLLLLLPRHHHHDPLTYQAPVPTGAARHREAWPVTHSSASSSWHSRHNLIHRNPSASPSCQCTTHTVACYLSTNLQTRA